MNSPNVRLMYRTAQRDRPGGLLQRHDFRPQPQPQEQEQEQATKPNAPSSQSQSLARYVPGEGLIFLFNHEGLESQPRAWKGTAASRMLNDTPLGAMFEDIAAQVIDRGLQAMPSAPVNGKEVVGVLSHLASKAICHRRSGSFNPPQPKAAVVVVREAAQNEVATRLLKQLEDALEACRAAEWA